jgi:hypothetical protein
MCSYNKVGSAWACESGSLVTDILKNELDFHQVRTREWRETLMYKKGRVLTMTGYVDAR